MSKKIIYSFLIIISILLQISVVPALSRSHVFADNVLMLILAWSVIDGFSGFLKWAVIAGILYDLATYSIVGVHVLIFLGAVYLVSFLSRRFAADFRGMGILLFLGFVIVATIFSHFVYAFVSAWEMDSMRGFALSLGGLSSVILEVAYNTIVFFIWFWLIKKTKNFFALETI
ncbi:MAG TPA: rod shape-determining protein MreD [Patescibacteria group bacterium]